MTTGKFLISPQEKEVAVSVLEKMERLKRKRELRLIGFEALFELLDRDEKALVKKIRDLNPAVYGFKGPYLGRPPVPKNLVALRRQKYEKNGENKKIETQYLPQPVYLAYRKLNAALHRDTGKKLLVASGYRSPAYQAIVFLRYLVVNKFNVRKTARGVAIPGFSQHGYPAEQALDFLIASGLPNNWKPTAFARSAEYRWLLAKAARFGFYLSYPRNNPWGVMFEPWHWQFKKKFYT
ncbi:MAG: D-alanyl-D-alanine carboxypeptidase family protein [Patescibacteria group bacterium]